jgi:hypothetical protein
MNLVDQQAFTPTLPQRERRRDGASNPFSRREKVAGASRPDEGRRRDSANYHLGLGPFESPSALSVAGFSRRASRIQ